MTFRGLPAHPLLVHAVVVLLPLAALALVLHAFWPAARRRLGVVTPLLALVVLVLVPITTHAGEELKDSLGADSNPLIRRHEQLADQILPWSIALFVLAAAQWWWTGPGVRVLAGPDGARASGGARRWVGTALAVVGLVVAVGATVVLLRAGEAGARATWGG